MSDSERRPGNLARSRRNLVKGTALFVGALPVLIASSAKAQSQGESLGGWLEQLLNLLFGGKGNQGGNGGGSGGSGSGGGHTCFLRGTMIRTVDGYRPVESLSAGDLLPTSFSGTAPIREIRHFCYERQSPDEAWPELARPVRIRASALADNVPHADLYLSRQHSLFIGGALTPAWNLVNGTSITIDDADHLDVIEYFHIELDQHDVIDAEGAPCDTLRASSEGAMSSDDGRKEYDGTVVSGVCAPLRDYRNRSNMLKSRLRSALSPIVDVRRPLDCIRDRIEERVSVSA
jgi:hypothetical protein